MAKLYFHYSTMNAGKSTVLLQAAHNYIENEMQVYLLTARFDNRAGDGRIASRIGIGKEADTFDVADNLFAKIEKRLRDSPCACIFVDEAQFLTEEHVWQLARAVDDLKASIFAANCFPALPLCSRSATRCAKCVRFVIAARRPRWSFVRTKKGAR
jgi:thymidine kinase